MNKNCLLLQNRWDTQQQVSSPLFLADGRAAPLLLVTFILPVSSSTQPPVTRGHIIRIPPTLHCCTQVWAHSSSQ